MSIQADFRHAEAERTVQCLMADHLPNTYKNAPRLWRPSLHTICSRIAMFPPQLVHYFIIQYTRKKDIVADCWAGMGTVPLQACLTGRMGIGNDISPEAYAVTLAKLDPVNPFELTDYLRDLQYRVQNWNVGLPDFEEFGLEISTYYHPQILKEILILRALLEEDLQGKRHLVKCARFTRALMLGILHGDREESLSIPLDSAKALSPTHILKMRKWKNDMYSPIYKRPVVDSLRIKASKVFRDPFPPHKGVAFNKDAGKLHLDCQVQLIITSPPYLGVHTYAYDNRIRLWFLGYSYKDIQKKLLRTNDERKYLDTVVNVLKHMQEYMDNNAACVVVLGDVRKGDRIVPLGDLLATKWSDSPNTEMQLVQIITDRMPRGRKRYYNIGNNKGVRTERILIFEKGCPKRQDVNVDWMLRGSY